LAIFEEKKKLWKCYAPGREKTKRFRFQNVVILLKKSNERGKLTAPWGRKNSIQFYFGHKTLIFIASFAGGGREIERG
jgi:hypothetical protein